MSCVPVAPVLVDSALLALLNRHQTALADLITIAELENTLLEENPGPLPLSLVQAQEALAHDYARLTDALKPHLRTLCATGALDAGSLEERTRHLVSLMKDNHRRLDDQRRVTHRRVAMVMQAIAAREDRASHAGPSLVVVSGGITDTPDAAPSSPRSPTSPSTNPSTSPPARLAAWS